MDQAANAFVPGNELETMLLRAMSGEIQVEEFLSAFMRARIVIPSATEVAADGTGISSLFFDTDGQQMLAVFTSLARATPMAHVATFCVEMVGHEALTRMRPGFGLVLNPGWSAGLEIPPSGIAQFATAFRAGSI